MASCRARRHGPLRAGLIASAMALVLAPGCEGTEPTCFGLKVDDRIAITVVETYAEPDQLDECGFGFDISPGLVLHATVVNALLALPDTCRAAIPTYEPFGGWTLMLSPDQGGQSYPDILFGQYEESNGTCAGQTQIALQVTENANPFAPSVQGQTPNVVMDREFSRSTASMPGCPASCFGEFVVNLQKL